MTTATVAELPERFHPRVDANFMVKLWVNGKAVLTKARDVSMAGLCLVSNQVPTTQTVKLSIPLPNDREVTTEAKVMRRANGQTAVEFSQLDWDDMFAMARFLHPRLR